MISFGVKQFDKIAILLLSFLLPFLLIAIILIAYPYLGIPDEFFDNSSNSLDNRPEHSILIAASDSSAATKAAANYVCDGVNDQVEIQNAINALPVTGGEVVLSEGTFQSAGKIILRKRITLKGSGENTSILHLTRGIDILVSNVTLSDFTFTGKGYILIRNSHVRLRNITAYRLDNSNIAAFMVYTWAGATTIEDIEFTNCKAIDCNRWCFIHDSEVSNGVIRNVTYTNCQAVNCGRYGQYYDPANPTEAWDVGFDIAERVSLVENITYENCLAEGAWESGFHTESVPEVRDVRLINCISRNNAQKEKTGWGPAVYGAGFLVSKGITLENCVSEDNKRGYRIYWGGVQLINSRDSRSGIGIYVYPSEKATSISAEKATSISRCRVEDAPLPVQLYGRMYGGVTIDNLAISSSTKRWGPAIKVASGTTGADRILVRDSDIQGYDVGVYNYAVEKVKVDTVQVTGASTNFVNCEILNPQNLNLLGIYTIP